MTNNSADKFGGAIFLKDVGSSLRVRDSMFGGNRAGKGAVFVPFFMGTGAIVFSNCSFVRNIADSQEGVFWGVQCFHVGQPVCWE